MAPARSRDVQPRQSTKAAKRRVLLSVVLFQGSTAAAASTAKVWRAVQSILGITRRRCKLVLLLVGQFLLVLLLLELRGGLRWLWQVILDVVVMVTTVDVDRFRACYRY